MGRNPEARQAKRPRVQKDSKASPRNKIRQVSSKNRSIAALNELLEGLEAKKIHYRIEHNRSDAIMVCVAVPGELWEIEFLEDGDIEVERFRSDGDIEGPEAIDELFDKFGD